MEGGTFGLSVCQVSTRDMWVICHYPYALPDPLGQWCELPDDA